MKTMTQDNVTVLRTRLQNLTTADAADHLRTLGIHRSTLRGLNVRTTARTIAGRARTLRILPDREDLKTPVNGPANRGLYDSMNEGEVLVIDAMACIDKAVLGDMMFSRIAARKASAVIVDGAVRDISHAQHKPFPVYARAISPESYMGWLRPWENDVPIQCGGVLVMPGDWILADTDGQVVIPAHLAEPLADLAEAKQKLDAFSQALLAAGHPLDDTYPLPAHMKGFLAAFTDTGALPSHDEIRRARQALQG